MAEAAKADYAPAELRKERTTKAINIPPRWGEAKATVWVPVPI